MPDARPLVDALAALAGAPSSPDAQRAVHAALLEAEVLVPRDADGQVMIDRAGPSLVVFSTRETAEAWGSAADAVRVGARELAAFAVANGVEHVALDPAGPVAVTLGASDVRQLAAGERP